MYMCIMTVLYGIIYINYHVLHVHTTSRIRLYVPHDIKSPVAVARFALGGSSSLASL